jgi:hypothetical protein
MKKFEVKEHLDIPSKIFRKDIFIDGKLFEYEVDKKSLIKAKASGPDAFAKAQHDLSNHFLRCLSEMVGRKLTIEDVNAAKKTGLI